MNSKFTVYYGQIADYTFGSLKQANEYIEMMVTKYPKSYKVKEGYSIGLNFHGSTLS